MKATMRQATMRALHAGAAQRPGGQRDAAGARGGEQPRGGQPGHRDLVALPPAERRARGRTRRGTARRSQRRTGTRRAPPRRTTTCCRSDAVPGAGQPARPGDLGQHEVQEGDHRQHEEPEGDRALAGDVHARHLLVGGPAAGDAGSGSSRSPGTASGRPSSARAATAPLARQRGRADRRRPSRGLPPRCSAVSSAPAPRDGAPRGRVRPRLEGCTPRARQRGLARGPSDAPPRQRGAGQEVDDVVLAQIDQREAKRPCIGPAQRPCDRAGVGEQRVRPSRMWRSAATASQPGDCPRRTRKGDPSHPSRTPRRTRPSSGARGVLAALPRRGGVPGRSGREDPVDDGTQVEHGVGITAAPRRTARAGAPGGTARRRGGTKNHSQCAHTSDVSSDQ